MKRKSFHSLTLTFQSNPDIQLTYHLNQWSLFKLWISVCMCLKAEDKQSKVNERSTPQKQDLDVMWYKGSSSIMSKIYVTSINKRGINERIIILANLSKRKKDMYT